MQPAVQIADVVLADPGTVGRVRTGQIVLVRRPGFPGRLPSRAPPRPVHTAPDADPVAHSAHR